MSFSSPRLKFKTGGTSQTTKRTRILSRSASPDPSISKNVCQDNKSIKPDKSRPQDAGGADILDGHQLQVQEVLVDQGVLWVLADRLQDLPENESCD